LFIFRGEADDSQTTHKQLTHHFDEKTFFNWHGYQNVTYFKEKNFIRIPTKMLQSYFNLSF